MWNVLAAGMDSKNAAVARVATDGQLSGRRAEEIGRVPAIPAPAQAAARPTEGQTGDQLQHAANQIASVQSAGLHAHRRQNGFGKRDSSCQYFV